MLLVHIMKFAFRKRWELHSCGWFWRPIFYSLNYFSWEKQDLKLVTLLRTWFTVKRNTNSAHSPIYIFLFFVVFFIFYFILFYLFYLFFYIFFFYILLFFFYYIKKEQFKLFLFFKSPIPFHTIIKLLVHIRLFCLLLKFSSF